MADRRSALAALPPTTAGNARVTLSEVRPGSILQIAAWPETLTTVQGVIAVFLGAQVPKSGRGLAGADAAIATVAPGRYLIAGYASDLVSRFEAALAASDGAVTDLSHGQAILRLEGEAAADVLARCVALDLDPAVFPAGRVARTAIHHIDVLIHRLTETSFDLWVFRSFAESLAEWILDAGLEFPIEFQGSAPRPASQTDMPVV
jgi:heterotetrameric sarcosine oxidase gamma subunit